MGSQKVRHDWATELNSITFYSFFVPLHRVSTFPVKVILLYTHTHTYIWYALFIGWKWFWSFNWRKIALQSCVHFCHTTWISHKYTCAPPFRTSLLSPIPPHPSRLSQSPGLSFLRYITQQRPTRYHFTYAKYVSMLLSQFVPFSFPHFVHKSVLYVCVYSYPANRSISTIFLDSIFIHFLTHFTLCNRI